MAERAVVLFAHGARDPEWARPLERLRAQLRARLPGERVALAFLERMRPSLPECAAALHAEGVRALRIVPVFFGAGGHLKSDLPALVARLRERHADLEIAVDPPIGEQESVIAAIAAAVAR
ncbi:MAG TPA: CbiX/SirB N-terminal domain-containing protein [Burkholderiales bacterium]|nr:CbiX/SirB N-terminal domain-containing protein [Burkholderiales bacterium]